MLPAAHRLRRSGDFATTVRRGRRVARGCVVVHLLRTEPSADSSPLDSSPGGVPVLATGQQPASTVSAIVHSPAAQQPGPAHPLSPPSAEQQSGLTVSLNRPPAAQSDPASGAAPGYFGHPGVSAAATPAPTPTAGSDVTIDTSGRAGAAGDAAGLIDDLDRGSAPGEPARAGFVVSKAVGKAVVRNKVKRRLRHLMAERIDRMPPGATIVVRAQPSAAGSRYQQMAKDLEKALDAALRSGRRQ